VVLDDSSRFIPAGGEFTAATAENGIESAINISPNQRITSGMGWGDDSYGML